MNRKTQKWTGKLRNRPENTEMDWMNSEMKRKRLEMNKNKICTESVQKTVSVLIFKSLLNY
jgi:hypothetical protein